MRENLKDSASSVARNVKRNGNDGNGYALNSENSDLFDRILDVFDSVYISSIAPYSQRSRKSVNPLKNIIDIISNSQSAPKNSSNVTLNIDSTKLTEVLDEIAQTLLRQQNSLDAQISALKEETKKSYDELNEKYIFAQNQVRNYKNQIQSVAEGLQSLITSRDESKDLIRILKVMGMDAVFPDEIDAEEIPKYFTVLKTTLPDNTLVTPCIKLGDEIFVRGEIIKYVEETQ